MPGGDDDLDEPPPRAKEPVAPREPAPARQIVDDDLPSRPAPATTVETPRVVDDETPAVAVPGTAVVRRTVEDVESPGEPEGPPMGLIVGGAIGGALVLAAGAGVGGYFLFTSLQSAGVTVIVQPK
jgi:hypothetical protein